ncbi:MAG: PorV/PorQ family protein [Candidatus Firestonebacteria bacterium]
MKFLKVIIFISFISSSAVFADGSAGFQGEYLYSFSGGARQAGMGYTGTALPFDSGSVYFNPSAIAGSADKEVGLFYIPVLSGVSYSYFSVVYPLSSGNVIGIARAALDVTGIDKTDASGASTGTASAGESCYFFTYANTLVPGISIGGTVKLLAQSLDVYSANAYGFDLGASLSVLPGVITGAMLQNIIVSQLTLRNTAENFPVNLRAGISVVLLDGTFIASGDFSAMNLLAPGADYSSGIKYSARWSAGIEYRPAGSFAVRAGANSRELSAGFGYRTSDFDIDYAVGFHEMGIKHMVGLKARFGLLPTEQEKWLIEKEKEVDLKIYISRAGKYLKEKRFDLAKEEINAALIVDFENKEALNLIIEVQTAEVKAKALGIMEEAFAAFDAGKEAEGRKKVEEAEALEPKITENLEAEYIASSGSLINERKYSEARKLLNRTMFINPSNEEAAELLKQLLSVMEFVQ